MTFSLDWDSRLDIAIDASFVSTEFTALSKLHWLCIKNSSNLK